MDLGSYIRDIPDWPTEGVLFKDITPLLADPDGFKQVIAMLTEAYADKGITKVLGAEARGFILGGALAYTLGAGFVPARKPGKLPWNTASASYELEYGEATLEIHEDAFDADDRVLIVDDVLATGGTAAAKVDLVRSMGAEVAGCAFLIELGFLNGREKLPEDLPLVSLIHVD
ncbi:MAG: adenine phosphoribosyltransferase [Coriobacteriia bacterium]|nr:adenine phosphoribosyltransferase [Coriobacteriia bacterium]